MPKPLELSGYSNISPLKSGGMGRVYRATRIGAGGFKKHFVIKRLRENLSENPQAKELLKREIEIQTSLRHPNIVGLQDVFTNQGETFLTLDYVDGISLADMLKSLPPQSELSESQILLIISDALQGLSYLHDLKGNNGQPLGLCHRDLNPGNLLIGNDGWTKLADFGLSKSRETSNHTQLGVIKGQLRFLAPESIENGETSPQTDLYSLCAILWELYFKRPLIFAKSPYETLQAISKQKHPKIFPKHRPPSPLLEHLFQKGLEPNPKNRFENANLILELISNEIGWALIPERANLGELVNQIRSGKTQTELKKSRKKINLTLKEPVFAEKPGKLSATFIRFLAVPFFLPLFLWRAGTRGSIALKSFAQTFSAGASEGRSP